SVAEGLLAMKHTAFALALAAALGGYAGPAPAQSTWNNPAGGDWLSPANWTGAVPNAAGASAAFTGVATGPIAVTLSAAVTGGTVTFDNITNANTAYTIGSTGTTITLSNNGGGAQLVVTPGVTSTATQQFAAGTTLNVADAGGLTVTHNGAGPLTVNGV